MSLSNPTRRRSRYAAVALLALLHVALIALLLGGQSTRDRPAESVVTMTLATTPSTPPSTRPALVPRTSRARPANRRAPKLPVATPPIAHAVPDTAPVDTPITTPITTPGAGPDAGPALSAIPAPGGASAVVPRLDLEIPREFYTHPPPLTAAQEAMRDPRSNRLVLTKRERIDIDFGMYECVAWVREPDGSIYRGPGHLQRVQDVGTNPFNGRRGEECVK